MTAGRAYPVLMATLRGPEPAAGESAPTPAPWEANAHATCDSLSLRGTLRVQHQAGLLDVAAGQAVIAHRGEWVRYSTPLAGGAEYIAVCLPAFSSETVHRDA